MPKNQDPGASTGAPQLCATQLETLFDVLFVLLAMKKVWGFKAWIHNTTRLQTSPSLSRLSLFIWQNTISKSWAFRGWFGWFERLIWGGAMSVGVPQGFIFGPISLILEEKNMCWYLFDMRCADGSRGERRFWKLAWICYASLTSVGFIHQWAKTRTRNTILTFSRKSRERMCEFPEYYRV